MQAANSLSDREQDLHAGQGPADHSTISNVILDNADKFLAHLESNEALLRQVAVPGKAPSPAQSASAADEVPSAAEEAPSAAEEAPAYGNSATGT